MHTQSLFLDKKLTFEKVAGPMTRLADDSQKWEQEITQEAYKQLPYLSDFEIHVVLDRVDEERGYAFGSIEMMPKSQMTFDERKERPLDKVHIPIVIRDQMMCPLDVFIHNKQYHPMTEARLRESLFRPDTFDAARMRPPEPSIYTDLQPPLGDGRIGGGGIKLAEAEPTQAELDKQAFFGNLMKNAPTKLIGSEAIRAGMQPVHDVSSAAAKILKKPSAGAAAKKTLRSAEAIRGVKLATVLPLLPQLHGTVLQRHIDRVKMAMQDPSIRSILASAGDGVKAAFASAAQMTPTDVIASAKTAMISIPPNVVQFTKLANGKYLMKWANTEGYAPQEQQVDQQQAQSLMSEPDMVTRVEADGSVTVSPDAAVKQTLDTGDIKAADQFGLWSVQDTNGNTLVGWVFPQLLSFDLQPLPLTLFSNGSQHALQEHVAGKLLGKSTDIPKGVPQGYGCFYYIDHGNAKAFVPMHVQSSFQRPDGGIGYTAQLDTGEQLVIYSAPELKTVQMTGEGEYAVPSTMCWLPLKAQVELVEEPQMFTKSAFRDWTGTVELLGDAGTFSFRGPAVAKLAQADKTFLDYRNAQFLGVALGIEPDALKTAMAQVSDGRAPTGFYGVRIITPLAEKIAEAKQKVASALAEVDIKNFDLTKEAAILDDALTTDKVLSLGFLNAENVATFVDMLPGLEAAASRIAEMLVASRLGMKDIPEVALERLLKAMDEVILGLRRLKQKELSFSEI